MSTLCNDDLIELTQGEHVDATLRIRTKDGSIFKLPVADVTEIVVKVKDVNGDCVEKKLSVGPSEVEIASEDGGEITVHWLPADTNLFPVGPLQSFQADITKSGKIKKAKFKEALTVEADVC